MANISGRIGKTYEVDMEGVPDELVFGLDIGTRNIVGTIGYKNDEDKFVVVAQTSMEHQTRSMLDGQIHDIGKVAATIEILHDKLEKMTGRKFKDVCIAAAGRVLKTVEAVARMDFSDETVVTGEHIYSLEMLGVENAYASIREESKNSGVKFYCVGYSVKSYYQNEYLISNLEGHKSSSIRADLIATFLPDDVVDGLYAAVERAGLYVANLTLEPIAAINVAIPERFRLLNIALVDVGAGTSDISITKDGSIIAYGMIPYAGDEITECIAKHYLTDFNEADRAKRSLAEGEEVEICDIMGIVQRVKAEEVFSVTKDTVAMITKNISDKIKELNGGKSVSAVFVVGGGGKIKGFVEHLAKFLDLPKERVALRGSEVLSDVIFMQDEITVDSLLVTPIGICMNYYEQRNNFIFVNVNGERIKLYDNSKLTVADAALQIGYPNEDLFPKRGGSLVYYVNGEKRMLRGKEGEAAVVLLDGREAGISAPIGQNSVIEISPSTRGADASLEIGQIPEYKSRMDIVFNGKKISCPRFATVNGELATEFYEIRSEDRIEMLEYYTLEQVLDFMDIIYRGKVYLNNVPASMDAKVYENFSISCEIMKEEPNYEQLMEEYGDGQFPDVEEYKEEEEETPEEPGIPAGEPRGRTAWTSDDDVSGVFDDIDFEALQTAKLTDAPTDTITIDVEAPNNKNDAKDNAPVTKEAPRGGAKKKAIKITVNGEDVVMTGKSEYILVDVLDFYPVDTSVAHGDRLETSVNGSLCDFVQPIAEGDRVKIEWVG